MLHGHSLRTLTTMLQTTRPLSLVWMMATLEAAASTTPITCEAGACAVSEKTAVTCRFNEDVSASRRGISVVQYPFNASRDDLGTHVLSCVWPESGKPVCSVEDGFYFNYNVTDRLTLEIPSATELLAGDYACCLVSSDHIPVQTCSLIVQGALKTTGEPTLSTTMRSQKTSPYSDTGNSQGTFETAFFVILPICMLTVVLLVVMAVCLRKACTAKIRKSCKRFPDADCYEGITTVVCQTPAGSSNGAERSEKRYDDSPAVESATPMLIEDGLPSATLNSRDLAVKIFQQHSSRAEDGSVDVHQQGLQMCVAGS